MRGLLAAPVLVLMAVNATAQSRALDAYLNSPVLRQAAAAVAAKDPAARTQAEIRNLLPHQQSQSFVNFIQVTRVRSLLDDIDRLRLNKMLTAPPGTGGTSLVSRVAGPAILGTAIEYGGILQRTSGQLTTLRANALGVGRMLFGAEQFPYCPEIDSSGCQVSARLLRTLSASVALENRREPASSADPAEPTATELLSGDFRTASWGFRVDITPSNHLDDPKYVTTWAATIDRLRKDPVSGSLSQAIVAFFKTALTTEGYTNWMAESVDLLAKAAGESEFNELLEDRLTLLTVQLTALDPHFSTNVTALSRAYSNYFDVRDALIREAQVHKLSVEFTNLRPIGTPQMWNARLVYSHQPTVSPTLVTANLSSTWYNDAGPNGERWRDVQVAGQLDRRLSEIPRFGHAVATFALYYQWMRSDALIKLPAGTVAPGTGIELPAEASTLLGTKGHIVVAQAQLTIPMGETVKVPISWTWANRSELIKEQDVRGQIGLTLDLDGLFH
jgi:hypothetical protein